MINAIVIILHLPIDRYIDTPSQDGTTILLVAVLTRFYYYKLLSISLSLLFSSLLPSRVFTLIQRFIFLLPPDFCFFFLFFSLLRYKRWSLTKSYLTTIRVYRMVSKTIDNRELFSIYMVIRELGYYMNSETFYLFVSVFFFFFISYLFVLFFFYYALHVFLFVLSLPLSLYFSFLIYLFFIFYFSILLNRELCPRILPNIYITVLPHRFYNNKQHREHWETTI